MTLASTLSVDECASHLRSITAAPLVDSGERPVRGFVRGRRFYVGRASAAPMPLATRIAGRLRAAGDTTEIDLAIGPSPIGGLFFTLVAALLASAALAATFAARSAGLLATLPIVWMTLVAFVIVFFVLPATDHERDRAYLLGQIARALAARARA